MRIAWVSDFSVKEVSGGGERADSVIMDELRSFGVEVDFIKSISATVEDLELYDYVVFSNRVMCSDEVLSWASGRGLYSIVEHDCQFVKGRDAAKYVYCKPPPSDALRPWLYRSADAVFAMSALHADAILSAVPGANVVNLKTSFWDEGSYAILRKFARDRASCEPKHDKFATKWRNAHKNSSEVKCKKLKEMPQEELWENFASHKTYVFRPQIFESFSRVCAEAKMVGCGVETTPKRIGFFSDHKGYSGEELIDRLEGLQREAIDTIRTHIVGDSKVVDCTVILNVYRRPQLLIEQMEAVSNLRKAPKDVIVWVNDHEDNYDHFALKNARDRGFDVIRASRNHKYHGRFAAGLLASTEYVAFFDDDTIPGQGWFDICFSVYGKSLLEDGNVLGGVGIKLHSNNYREHDRVGWPTKNEEWEEVDLVGHAWVLRRDCLSYFFREPMIFDGATGEDIHLSHMIQKYGGGKTFVPPQANPDHLSSVKGYEYGIDQVASSHPKNHAEFYSLRDEIVRQKIEEGWRRTSGES